MPETHTRLTLHLQRQTGEAAAHGNATYTDTSIPIQIGRYLEVVSALCELSSETSHIAFTWHHLESKYTGEQLTLRALRQSIHQNSTGISIDTFDVQIADPYAATHPLIVMADYSLTASGLFAPDRLRERYDALCERLDRQRLGGFDTTIGEFGDSPPAA